MDSRFTPIEQVFSDLTETGRVALRRAGARSQPCIERLPGHLEFEAKSAHLFAALP